MWYEPENCAQIRGRERESANTWPVVVLADLSFIPGSVSSGFWQQITESSRFWFERWERLTFKEQWTVDGLVGTDWMGKFFVNFYPPLLSACVQ